MLVVSYAALRAYRRLPECGEGGAIPAAGLPSHAKVGGGAALRCVRRREWKVLERV